MGISLANPILIELCIESEIVSKKKMHFFSPDRLFVQIWPFHTKTEIIEENSNHSLDIAIHLMIFRSSYHYGISIPL